MNRPRSFLEASARDRVLAILDPQSWQEILPPSRRLSSPHLARLDLPQALDDGIVVGRGTLAGADVLIAAQEGRFNGGSVGEIHGAKLAGLLQAALTLRPAGVLLLIDSGGVRLHEANAGILAISEVMRAVLAVRAAGIPVLALLGGSCGAFGGMGIVTRLCHLVVMSEEARLGLSGPEVIETVKGPQEFDSRDRALVWRVTGGKTRRALGEADRLVADSMDAFRAAALEWLGDAAQRGVPALTLADLRARQTQWQQRHAVFAAARDGREILAACSRLAEADAVLASAAQFEAALLPLPGSTSGADMPAQPESVSAPLQGADLACADRLFGAGRHALRAAGLFVSGQVELADGPAWLVGTRERAAMDGALALRMAAAVLDAVATDVRSGRPRPVLLLAETQGQALSRHEELLGLHGALAHLALCVDLARRAGHRLLTLVREEAVSGGFLSFGMLGDRICALPGAEIRVMDLRAMARVTRIPLERLEMLAREAPVFAPGAQNFHQLGGVHEVWSESGDWPDVLATALAVAGSTDDRAALGAQRGGRRLAASVQAEVRAALGAP